MKHTFAWSPFPSRSSIHASLRKYDITLTILLFLTSAPTLSCSEHDDAPRRTLSGIEGDLVQREQQDKAVTSPREALLQKVPPWMWVSLASPEALQHLARIPSAYGKPTFGILDESVDENGKPTRTLILQPIARLRFLPILDKLQLEISSVAHVAYCLERPSEDGVFLILVEDSNGRTKLLKLLSAHDSTVDRIAPGVSLWDDLEGLKVGCVAVSGSVVVVGPQRAIQQCVSAWREEKTVLDSPGVRRALSLAGTPEAFLLDCSPGTIDNSGATVFEYFASLTSFDSWPDNGTTEFDTVVTFPSSELGQKARDTILKMMEKDESVVSVKKPGVDLVLTRSGRLIDILEGRY